MILQKSTQNVNSNAGVSLAQQLLDRMGGFSRFDGWQKAARSVPCQRCSNSSRVKAQVARRARGKTTFSDIAAHQQDDLFTDAICGDVPPEPTFRQRLGIIAAMFPSCPGTPPTRSSACATNTARAKSPPGLQLQINP